jgi:hypothetical protein
MRPLTETYTRPGLASYIRGQGIDRPDLLVLLEGLGWMYSRAGAYAAHDIDLANGLTVTAGTYATLEGYDLILSPRRPSVGAGAHPSTPTTEFYELELHTLTADCDLRAVVYVFEDGDELPASTTTVTGLGTGGAEAEIRQLLRVAVASEGGYVLVRWEAQTAGAPPRVYHMSARETVLASPYDLDLVAHADEYLGPYADGAGVTSLDDGDSGAGALTATSGSAPTRDADDVGAGVDALAFTGAASERLTQPTTRDVSAETALIMGAIIERGAAGTEIALELGDTLGATASLDFTATNIIARVSTSAGSRSVSVAWPGTGYHSVLAWWVAGEGLSLYIDGDLAGTSSTVGGTLSGSAAYVTLGAAAAGGSPFTGKVALPFVAVGPDFDHARALGLLAWWRHTTGV